MPIAIITGASRGFGRALATDLAKDGWGLVIDGRGAERLAEADVYLRSLGAMVHAIPGDVTSPRHQTALVKAAGELGGADLVVNNASTLGRSGLHTLDLLAAADLVHVYEVNVFAPLALLQLALPLLHAAKGTIVALTSDAALEAYEGWGAYGSSKAALDQMHHVLAVEHPELRVYQFDPGDMRTDLHQSAYPGEDISDRPEPETVVPALRRLLEARPPSGRYRAIDWTAP